MGIRKDVTLDATGAAAGYHVIQHATTDMLNKTSSASITSYVSEETFKAGKQPVQGMLPVFVKGVPADDENTIAFLQKALIAAQPETPDPSEAALPYAANRYLFAGGVVA